MLIKHLLRSKLLKIFFASLFLSSDDITMIVSFNAVSCQYGADAHLREK